MACEKPNKFHTSLYVCDHWYVLMTLPSNFSLKCVYNGMALYSSMVVLMYMIQQFLTHSEFKAKPCYVGGGKVVPGKICVRQDEAQFLVESTQILPRNRR